MSGSSCVILLLLFYVEMWSRRTTNTVLNGELFNVIVGVLTCQNKAYSGFTGYVFSPTEGKAKVHQAIHKSLCDDVPAVTCTAQLEDEHHCVKRQTDNTI